MTWNELRKPLQVIPPEKLIELLKGLYDLSPQNKAWLQAQVMPLDQNVDYLEDCRKKIISAYKAATHDAAGILDLMLTVVERGQAFTNEFGDIDEPFYDRLTNMLGSFRDELRKEPSAARLYADFRPRLLTINRSSDIGWGYGDFIRETVAELESEFGR